jgi:hypothetical protein
VYFCWRCLSEECQCHIASARKHRRYAKWSERKRAKAKAQKEAAAVAGGNNNNNNNNNNNIFVVLNVAAPGVQAVPVLNVAVPDVQAVVPVVPVEAPNNSASNNSGSVLSRVARSLSGVVVREILELLPKSRETQEYDMLRSSM